MYINSYYRKTLEKILETGDTSRIEVARSEMYNLHKEFVTFLIPLKGMERADCIVYGAYFSELSCFTSLREKEIELAEKVGATVKYFLLLASTSAKRERIADSTIQALLAWQQAYADCLDEQKKYFETRQKVGVQAAEAVSHCAITQKRLEKARRAMQKQVETEDLDYLE